MQKRWAKAKQSRSQLVMFSPSLDAMVPQGHAVRQLDEVLLSLDWSEWEHRYDGHRGQPAIHPRLLAGAILYGIVLGFRSSRKLEDATRNRIDFMWYLEGMTIDHSTFAQFRQKYNKELKSIFRQINKAALRLSMSKLTELAADGTRLRASSSKDGMRTAETLQRYLDEISCKFSKALEKMTSEDIANAPEHGSQEELKRELATLEHKRLQYSKALEIAKQRDEIRIKKQGKSTKAVRVPVSDPDSHLLPNKEGGYAPNYTPTAVVDRESRLIIADDVVTGNAEADCIMAAVEEVKTEYDQTPERMSFDGNLASGTNLSDLASKDISAYSTVGVAPSEVVLRSDLSVPVAEKYLKKLPCRGKSKQLDRTAFIFDGTSYWCPMGKCLSREKKRNKVLRGGVIRETVYRCKACIGCSLAKRCLSKQAKYRTITRDENEKYREQLAIRMKTEEAQEIYKRRSPLAETIFGYVKGALNIRHFLTRGLANVRTEWRWICAAHNLRVLFSIMKGKAAV